MKIIVFVSFVIFLVGCGARTQYNKQLILAPETVDIVAKFERESSVLDAPVVIDNLIIELVDSLPTDNNYSTLGQCESNRISEKTNIFGHKTIIYEAPRIRLLKSYFNSITPAAKEIILFHELGHCVLNLRHIDGYDSNKLRYYSIMRSVIIESSNYITNYDYYQKQLFGKIKVNADPSEYDFAYMVYFPATQSLVNDESLIEAVLNEDEIVENKQQHCMDIH